MDSGKILPAGTRTALRWVAAGGLALASLTACGGSSAGTNAASSQPASGAPASAAITCPLSVSMINQTFRASVQAGGKGAAPGSVCYFSNVPGIDFSLASADAVNGQAGDSLAVSLVTQDAQAAQSVYEFTKPEIATDQPGFVSHPEWGPNSFVLASTVQAAPGGASATLGSAAWPGYALAIQGNALADLSTSEVDTALAQLVNDARNSAEAASTPPSPAGASPASGLPAALLPEADHARKVLAALKSCQTECQSYADAVYRLSGPFVADLASSSAISNKVAGDLIAPLQSLQNSMMAYVEDRGPLADVIADATAADEALASVGAIAQ